MRTRDFSYELPEELIARHPAPRRDHSRLLRLDRRSGAISHHRFHELGSLLRCKDRLLLNDTRVLPARLYCRKDSGGRVEVLFLARIDGRCWSALVRPGRYLPPGAQVYVEACPQARLKVVQVLDDGRRLMRLADASPYPTIEALMAHTGVAPLPPYIDRPAEARDRLRYQTVYARQNGSAAAPTAGLHFTPRLLSRLKLQGIDHSFLTLHVGIGTFKPVSEEDPANHPIHTEFFSLPLQTIREIEKSRRDGGRVVAVGTTSVRVLEHCWRNGAPDEGREGECGLYILPGFNFQAVDALITNFHLPRSTLLMLVSAYAGREAVLNAYREAIRLRYRFFSYGDAMLVV